MFRRFAVAAVAAAILAAVPATANASYTIPQGRAEAHAIDAADFRYEPWGVEATSAWCYPQGHYSPNSDYAPGRYHRWVCSWVGTDGDGLDVHGAFRITGHTGNRYGYMPLFGGLRWNA